MRQRNFVAISVDLIRFNVELDEVSGAETRRYRNISCVAARCHENSTEARVSVACVKVDPSASKKDLIPCAEISGTAKRLTDVPDVAGDIARWNIHAASKCNGEVLEIAADPNSLDEDIRGGLGRSGGVVVKGDLVMHPIADGYRPFPTAFDGSELAVGDSAELINLAIPARQEKLQDLRGKILYKHLLRAGVLDIGKWVGFNYVRAGKPKVASGGQKAGAAIAEGINIVGRGHNGVGWKRHAKGFNEQFIAGTKARQERWV